MYEGLGVPAPLFSESITLAVLTGTVSGDDYYDTYYAQWWT